MRSYSLFFVAIVFSGSCFAQSDLVVGPASITSGTLAYQASNSITNATNTFTVSGSASVTFTAGNFIDLKPGFDAVAGTASPTFHAVINTSLQSGGGNPPPPPPPASSPAKEYIYRNGRPIAIENP